MPNTNFVSSLPPCFALCGKRCSILNRSTCFPKPYLCPFYKSRKKDRDDRWNAQKRLSTLPEERQTEISLAYYDAQVPWLEKEGA